MKLKVSELWQRGGQGTYDLLCRKQEAAAPGYLTRNNFNQGLAIVPKDALILSEKDKWWQLSLLGWRIMRRKALPP